jgi:hypothetical protein
MFMHKYIIEGETIYRITPSQTPGNLMISGAGETINLSEAKENALKRFQTALQEKEEESAEDKKEEKKANLIPLAELLRAKATTIQK